MIIEHTSYRVTFSDLQGPSIKEFIAIGQLFWTLILRMLFLKTQATNEKCKPQGEVVCEHSGQQLWLNFQFIGSINSHHMTEPSWMFSLGEVSNGSSIPNCLTYHMRDLKAELISWASSTTHVRNRFFFLFRLLILGYLFIQLRMSDYIQILL